jgi:RNA polymerase sigma-70 factor (ECF subfamily)
MNKPVTGIVLGTASARNTDSCREEFVCAFNQVRRDVVHVLYDMLGNYEDVHDTLQEAFVKCWRRLERIKEVRNLRGWIFRVSLNAARDLQRSAWRRRVRPLTVILPAVSNGPSPPEIAAHREDQRRLQAALADLRADEQEVYRLRMNSSLTYEEIASLRQCPVSTAKTQMRTAIARLRQVLGETGW